MSKSVPRLRTSVAARALAEDGHTTGQIVRWLEADGHNPSTVYAALSRLRIKKGEARTVQPRLIRVRITEEVYRRLAVRAAEERATISALARLLLARSSREFTNGNQTQ